MASHVTVSLEPTLQATGRVRVKWKVSQVNGRNVGISGSAQAVEGRKGDMIKVFKATVRNRVRDGFKVDAKVYTANGLLEEHATYNPDGSAHFHHVPPPEGEGGFGRACRVLSGTKTTAASRRKATAAPKRPKPPRKPRKAAAKPKPKPKAAPKRASTAKGAAVDPAILRAAGVKKGGGGRAAAKPKPKAAAKPKPKAAPKRASTAKGAAVDPAILRAAGVKKGGGARKDAAAKKAPPKKAPPKKTAPARKPASSRKTAPKKPATRKPARKPKAKPKADDMEAQMGAFLDWAQSSAGMKVLNSL